MAQIIFVILGFSLLFYKSCTQDLNNLAENTDHFYNDLLKKYDNKGFDDNVKHLMDQEIDQYQQNVLKQFHVLPNESSFLKTRIKKKGTEIFKDFEELLNLNISKVKDIIFFKKYLGYEHWFCVTLTSETLSIHEISEDKFVPVNHSHYVGNATKLHTATLSKGTFLLTESLNNIRVSYFYSQDKNYSIREIQNLNFPDVFHLSHWKSNDQLFIAVSTFEKLFIYLWEEKSFELLQTIPVRSKLTIPCRIEGSIFLISLEKQKTMIFKYHLGSFDKTQIIPRPFTDGAVVNLKDRNFLSLASKSRSIVYEFKKEENIFSPFQELSPADKILSTVNNDEALLILVNNRSLSAYQFDGWRFGKMSFGIEDIEIVKVVNYREKEFVLIKKADGTWSLNRFNWMRSKESNSRRYREIKRWCLDAMEKLSRAPEINDLSDLLNRQSIKLKVKKINGISAENVKNLTVRFDRLDVRIKAKAANNKSSPIPSFENVELSNLQAYTVRINCTGNCTVNLLITNMNCDFLSNSRRVDNESATLRFEHVKVEKLNEFVCPKPGVKIKEVQVNGLFNGVRFDDFQKNVLRTSGEQIVTAEHIIENLKTSSILASNIDAASFHTRQQINTPEIHARELVLPEGGLLMPLDGDPVSMTGTLTASRAKLSGPVHLRGGLRGNSVRRFTPMVHFPEAHELVGNYTLNNVRIARNFIARDVTRKNGGKSVRQIKDEAILINDGSMAVRLKLRSNRTIWKNVTVDKLPNWLTKKNSQKITVTGKKIAVSEVAMPESLYSTLPIPKLRAHACSESAAISNVRTSTVKVVKAKAKSVQSKSVYGAKQLHDKINDTVTSLSEADLSRKSFNGFVQIENLTISNFEDSPFWSFKKAKFMWSRPNYVKGPFDVKNLTVRSLNATSGVRIPCPLTVENMIVDGNLQVKKINGINLDEFVKSVVRVNDTVSMKKIVFGNLEVDEIKVAESNIDLQEFDENIYLGNKKISGRLEIEKDLDIPNILSYSPESEVATYYVEGSVGFDYEPQVSNFNSKNLEELLSEIWMLDRPVTFTGNFVLNNITLVDLSTPFESLVTPSFGSWRSLEGRILSKVKLQKIDVPVYLKAAKVPNIIARERSNLQFSDRDLNELFFNTLKKQGDQIITEQWNFNELIILDRLSLEGKVNNLNFSTDVARYDVDVNFVTGRKVVDYLTARNFMGLNFEDWAQNVLVISDSQASTVIKGKKIFGTLSAKSVNVRGTIMGKKPEQCLQNYGDQIVTAPKIIKGSLHCPSVTVKELVNDVDLAEFLNYRLKNNQAEQTIKSSVVFKNDLEIFGNFTVDEQLEGVELDKLDSMYQVFIPPARAVEYLKPFAMKMANLTIRPAKYWNKFEEVQENPLLVPKNSSSKDHASFTDFGNCVVTSLAEVKCDKGSKFTLKTFTNESSEVLFNRILAMKNTPLVVQVSSGQNGRITIFAYSSSTNSFEAKSVRAPGITEAAVSHLDGVAWIAARLKSQMLIVRYDGELQKFHLPPTGFFALEEVPPTNELVLVRDDGMWKLDGLDGPRHEFKVSMRAESVETIASEDGEFYVRMRCEDGGTRLLKARYVGA